MHDPFFQRGNSFVLVIINISYIITVGYIHNTYVSCLYVCMYVCMYVYTYTVWS